MSWLYVSKSKHLLDKMCIGYVFKSKHLLEEIYKSEPNQLCGAALCTGQSICNGESTMYNLEGGTVIKDLEKDGEGGGGQGQGIP